MWFPKHNEKYLFIYFVSFAGEANREEGQQNGVQGRKEESGKTIHEHQSSKARHSFVNHSSLLIEVTKINSVYHSQMNQVELFEWKWAGKLTWVLFTLPCFESNKEIHPRCRILIREKWEYLQLSRLSKNWDFSTYAYASVQYAIIRIHCTVFIWN